MPMHIRLPFYCDVIPLYDSLLASSNRSEENATALWLRLIGNANNSIANECLTCPLPGLLLSLSGSVGMTPILFCRCALGLFLLGNWNETGNSAHRSKPRDFHPCSLFRRGTRSRSRRGPYWTWRPPSRPRRRRSSWQRPGWRTGTCHIRWTLTRIIWGFCALSMDWYCSTTGHG